MVLTSDVERWTGLVVGGVGADVCRTITDGRELRSEPAAFRDYDLFVCADIAVLDTSYLPAWIDPLPDLADVRGHARFILFLDETLVRTKLIEHFRGGTQVVRRGQVMQFVSDPPLGGILQRRQASLAYEAQWQVQDGISVATNNTGKAVADQAERFLLLPVFTGEDPRPLVRDLLEGLPGWLSVGSMEVTPQPAWATELSWPRRQENATALARATEEALRADQARVQADEALAEESRWAELLWGQGKQRLEPLVRDALHRLGVEVEEPAASDREDLRFEDDGGVFIVEVTGSARHIDIDKVRQLMDWVDGEEVRQAESGSVLTVTGVMIANPFKDQPPGERNNAASYTPSARALATRRGFRLLLTSELFELVTGDALAGRAAALEWFTGRP